MSAIGAIGVISAATMVVTPLAGRAADRDGPDRMITVCLLGTLAARAVLALGEAGCTTRRERCNCRVGASG